MKKLFFIFFVFLFSFDFLFSQKQKSEDAVSFTKTELLSFNDVKDLLSAVSKRDYSQYTLLSFNLSGATAEHGAEGVTTSFTEPAPCGTWTEKQRLLIEKHSASAAVFTLERITMMEPAEPGTPYLPGSEVIFSVPNVSFYIEK